MDEPHVYHFPAFTPDGKFVTFLLGERNQNAALWAVAMSGGHKPFPILKPPSPLSSVAHYAVSPDGKWLAYMSDESGQYELYLTSFPKAEGKWKVTDGGGLFPAWRRDGKELFYKDGIDDYHALSFSATTTGPQFGAPQHLLHGAIGGLTMPYDVSADGKRLLVNLADDDQATPLNLVVNWPAQVRK